jgi:hypothetical protein
MANSPDCFRLERRRSTRPERIAGVRGQWDRNFGAAFAVWDFCPALQGLQCAASILSPEASVGFVVLPRKLVPSETA